MWRQAIVVAVTLVLALAIAVPAAQANWLTDLAGRAAGSGSSTLDQVATHVAALEPKPGVTALAADVSSDGHWSLVNRQGEAFTAATPAELKRGFALLAPDITRPDARLAIYLTEASVFAQRARLGDAPKGSALAIVAGKRSYPLVLRGNGREAQIYAEIRPNLLIAATDRAAFHETVFQLARALDRSSIRMIALEPGGPTTLSRSPRLEPGSSRAMIDTIDPERLEAALANIRGQTALLSARIKGPEQFVFKPSKGAEIERALVGLRSAAEAADVNLVFLESASARQPGGRNWLWQTIEVKGLDKALGHPTFADFFNALATPANRLAIAANLSAGDRTLLDIRPIKDLPASAASSYSRIGEALGDLVAEMGGKVVSEGATAFVASESRRRELDARIVSWLPATVHWTYGVLALLGSIGLPVARQWWPKIWPGETRGDYASAIGFWLARGVRGIVYWLAFVPIAGPVTAAWQVLAWLGGVATVPMRLLRR